MTTDTLCRRHHNRQQEASTAWPVWAAWLTLQLQNQHGCALQDGQRVWSLQQGRGQVEVAYLCSIQPPATRSTTAVTLHAGSAASLRQARSAVYRGWLCASVQLMTALHGTVDNKTDVDSAAPITIAAAMKECCSLPETSTLALADHRALWIAPLTFQTQQQPACHAGLHGFDQLAAVIHYACLTG